MKFGAIIAIIVAVLLHSGFLLFGGLLFPGAKKSEASLQQVELLADEDPKTDEPEHKPEDTPEEIASEDEPPPDASEIMKSLELTPPTEAPALDAASLSAIEAALSGAAGSGDFAAAADLTGGGVIGGTGKAGAMSQELEDAFSLDDIDQKPRLVFQSPPVYPSEVRAQRLEGVVAIIFVVDQTGKVSNARVEKSSHAAFEKPALDAVRKWKFEPAVRGGKPVACKMRAPIRFQPS
jgi:protein TonB